MPSKEMMLEPVLEMGAVVKNMTNIFQLLALMDLIVEYFDIWQKSSTHILHDIPDNYRTGKPSPNNIF